MTISSRNPGVAARALLAVLVLLLGLLAPSLHEVGHALEAEHVAHHDAALDQPCSGCEAVLALNGQGVLLDEPDAPCAEAPARPPVLAVADAPAPAPRLAARSPRAPPAA